MGGVKKAYQLQKSPFLVPTTDGKHIAEHWGQATDGNKDISIAHMIAPSGWSEPAQCPEFDEYTFVFQGKKQIEINDETIILNAGESIKINKGNRVRYSNPFDKDCIYLAICQPAFSLDKVHRETSEN
ncbi:MAG: cupin domain-containing protein [Flavobacteriaceae bacterium]|nr:cupin domain-containing protein [Flavobacteriaceae bacterium]